MKLEDLKRGYYYRVLSGPNEGKVIFRVADHYFENYEFEIELSRKPEGWLPPTPIAPRCLNKWELLDNNWYGDYIYEELSGQ